MRCALLVDIAAGVQHDSSAAPAGRLQGLCVLRGYASRGCGASLGGSLGPGEGELEANADGGACGSAAPTDSSYGFWAGCAALCWVGLGGVGWVGLCQCPSSEGSGSVSRGRVVVVRRTLTACVCGLCQIVRLCGITLDTCVLADEICVSMMRKGWACAECLQEAMLSCLLWALTVVYRVVGLNSPCTSFVGRAAAVGLACAASWLQVCLGRESASRACRLPLMCLCLYVEWHTCMRVSRRSTCVLKSTSAPTRMVQH
jgi:hypothetical protein